MFTIHCNPSLAYIAVRDLQSSQRNASVQSSLLLAGNLLYNQLQPSVGEGEVANFRKFLGKNTIFNEHSVLQILWHVWVTEEEIFKRIPHLHTLRCLSLRQNISYLRTVWQIYIKRTIASCKLLQLSLLALFISF